MSRISCTLCGNELKKTETNTNLSDEEKKLTNQGGSYVCPDRLLHYHAIALTTKKYVDSLPIGSTLRSVAESDLYNIIQQGRYGAITGFP